MGSKGSFVLLGLLLILCVLYHSGEWSRGTWIWTIYAPSAMRFIPLRPQEDGADATGHGLALVLLPSSVTGPGLCDNSFLRFSVALSGAPS